MSRIKYSIQIGALILAWIALFYVFTFFTELTLTPWDGALDWPDVGTWQRTLNDFFAADPGRLIISIPVLLISICLTISTLRRNPAAINHLLRLHYAFIPLFLLAWLVSVALNHWVNPYPPVQYDPNFRGFHLTIIPGIGIIGSCLIWLWQQVRTANAPTLTSPEG
jgi:hypothetical protein